MNPARLYVIGRRLSKADETLQGSMLSKKMQQATGKDRNVLRKVHEEFKREWMSEEQVMFAFNSHVIEQLTQPPFKKPWALHFADRDSAVCAEVRREEEHHFYSFRLSRSPSTHTHASPELLLHYQGERLLHY